MFKEYEEQINNLIDKIKTAQGKFKTDNAKYFQSLKTGNKSLEVVPDMAKKASDENKEVPTISTTDKFPFEIEIHTHQLNSDWGYSIMLTAEVDGKIYKKSIGEGIGHTFDWQEVTNPDTHDTR
jgi:glutamine synthetase type III